MWRRKFTILKIFSWSCQWCKKRRQNLNMFWTYSQNIPRQRDLNFGAFYYIILNFSCSSKFKCWRETTSPPHFVSRTLGKDKDILNFQPNGTIRRLSSINILQEKEHATQKGQIKILRNLRSIFWLKNYKLSWLFSKSP